jgi:hypothetical protein
VIRVNIRVHTDGINGEEACAGRESVGEGLFEVSDEMFGVFDVGRLQFSNDFFQPVVDVF